MFKQQELDGTSGEGENNDNPDEDIGEILASMSSADALHLRPTAMRDGEESPILATPSQSVFSVTDSKASQDTIVGSRVNGALRCGLSSSTITLLIASLVVLCIEVPVQFVS